LILDTILAILYGVLFSARMLQLFNSDNSSFALWMFGIGIALAVIEMQILKGYIKSSIRRGWRDLNTINYLVASLPLILIVAIHFKNPIDALFIPVSMILIWLPLYLVFRIFKPVLETPHRNNNDAGK